MSFTKQTVQRHSHYWAEAFSHYCAGDDNEKWVPTVALECRGLEPFAYRPEVRGQILGRGPYQAHGRCVGLPLGLTHTVGMPVGLPRPDLHPGHCPCVSPFPSPQGDWEVESTGGTKFADVDFEAGEWTEYCEKLGESVAVYKIEGKFEQHRG